MWSSQLLQQPIFGAQTPNFSTINNVKHHDGEIVSP